MNAAMEEFFEQDAIKHFMPGLINPSQGVINDQDYNQIR